MGEYADMEIDMAMAELADDGRDYDYDDPDFAGRFAAQFRPRVCCKYCHSNDVGWKADNGKWQLINRDGTRHDCLSARIQRMCDGWSDEELKEAAKFSTSPKVNGIRNQVSRLTEAQRLLLARTIAWRK